MKVVLGDGDKLAENHIVSSSLPHVKPALLSTHDFLSTTSSSNHLTSLRLSARYPDGTPSVEQTTSSELRANEHSAWDMKRKDTWSLQHL